MISGEMAWCSRCLASFSLAGLSAEYARAKLLEHFWELRADGLTWCLDCSRKAREVRFPTTQRGVRRRRR